MLRIALAFFLVLPCGAAPVAQKEDARVLRLSARAEKHVREGHFASGRRSRGKSLFLPGTDLLELLKAAEKSKPRREANGRYKRVVAVDDAIGSDGRSGKPVKTYVVIAEPGGEVVTMYPGR
ncbi:MAG: hypothetical protein PHS14_01500 [Elusimicrobia bacterium]|nr:hypothetical protein [Elusimicrobiota bacterium]